MSKENKERKQKALEIIDQSMLRGGCSLPPDKVIALRDLIDPPISTLSRAEVESELAYLRELVARLEKMEEYAFELENKIDKMRDSIRVCSEALKAERYCSQSTPGLIKVIDAMHSLNKEINQ